MCKLQQLPFLLIAILIWSCKTDNKYPYAIKDFRKPLQPHLTRIVLKGIVGYYDSTLYMATDKELVQLAQSEHPVLRASAFREMLYRKSFDHFNILMNHLDDTAVVATEAGEWGIWYRTVSDDIIQHGGWKSMADKNKTIDVVITKHNYLRSAYEILLSIEPSEKYYPYIKAMAEQEVKPAGIYNPKVEDFESALYGLAKFKKKEDVEIIKDQLLSYTWRISSISFRLMKEFPDTVYLEVFEEYYPRKFYRSICRDGVSSQAEEYINSLAVYKNNRSAKILDSMLNRKPFINCPADTSWFKDILALAIWRNPCEAYSKLRKQVEARVKEYEKNTIELPAPDRLEFSIDTFAEKIRWYPLQ